MTRKHRTSPPILAIHGGAGTISAARMTPAREAQFRKALDRALTDGNAILSDGGSAMDAVAAAVVAMENSPLFNAGRGAVFNAARQHELDAAVMDGATRNAGAVAAVRRIKNPVLAARAVMERTPHVLLAAAGAERFARAAGLEMVAPEYFSTAARARSLERLKARARATAAERHGTVGAVALDAAGNLAAATSTGGYTNKLPGRVGDSPLVGAGVYADNASCAVSATGHGEIFIRAVLGYDVSARMLYLEESLAVAAQRALDRVAALGGDGGLIAVDRAGNIAMPFNSEGMYRGWTDGDRFEVAIYQ